MKIASLGDLFSRVIRLFSTSRLAGLFLGLSALQVVFLTSPSLVSAQEGAVLGIHIMHPGEASDAIQLFGGSDGQSEQWHYVTVPLTIADLKKPDEWAKFFAQSKEQKIIPIVRLVTRPEGEVWSRPTKKEVADYFLFLSQFEWPTPDRYVIIFNEVNHAREWGGVLDPAGYADILAFAKKWSLSEGISYKILPAAMDLGTPDTASARDGLKYIGQMLAARPQIFDSIDIWNSHSYPNPGFVSSPERQGKSSLRGFQNELAFIKQKTGKDYQVLITETGWRETPTTARWLESYYKYAMQHIWSDKRVMGVTPFVLRGDPGPYSQFSFLTSDGQQTLQYKAFQKVADGAK